jgi:hypothetical protein
MFKCELCNRSSQPREKSHKLVTKTRPRDYVNEHKRGLDKIKVTTHGWEIVEEIQVCKQDFDKHNKGISNG